MSEDAGCIDTHFRLGLDANHTMMNKFFGPHDKSYGFVKEQIRELAMNHERFIKDRTRLTGKSSYFAVLRPTLSLY